ncbi:MAG: DUF523 and DUF1722 domain-containing protein [Symbiopectobacterium sp.]|uniref:DUF523 and DUF1722 domain-containing protein n=1 Tax=Symbiopectobacterium sp. TaxID=2952789 RepID=UPI003F2DEA65
MSAPIPVGLSACLLGVPVRFDGGHKRFDFVVYQLAPYCHFQPVCPEMAVGLPVPRPALRVSGVFGSVPATVLASISPMRCSRFPIKKWHRCAICAVLSCVQNPPSCEMERVKVYDSQGKDTRKSGEWLFAQALKRYMPWLPLEENGRLSDPVLRENFIARVYALHELQQIWQQGLSRGALMGFHSRYKLLLLVHSQPEYRELGPFVAGMAQWPTLEAFATEYRLRFMRLLSHPASRRNHTNVLMHVQGYFHPHLTSQQRQKLANLIDRYRQGVQPLLAPMTLLRHYMTEYPDDYLAQQRYFDPYPEALRLRYGH